MYLTRLSLTNFRAFSRLDLDVPRRLILLVGDNAQGKTTLLEAVYFLATFSSFNTASDRQLISFSAAGDPVAVARIVAEFKRGGRSHSLEVRLIHETNGAGTPPRFRKEVLLDGVKKPVGEVYGQFNAVIFLPQMARIIEGGPEERRGYLNQTLNQTIPGYAAAIHEYGQALTQRNALLKLLSERGGDPDQLLSWDDLLAKRGAQIMLARIAALQDLERLARRIHHRLTHSAEVLRLVYQPAYEPLPQPKNQMSLPILTGVDRSAVPYNEIYQGFLKALMARRGEEIARGVTTIGPHRDELRFLSNGVDLGDFGSRGQVRTTLFSLKLAEVAWMKEKTGELPVLLLDEIMAELDAHRRADLLQTLSSAEQALVTTTDLKPFAGEFEGQSTLWQVKSGRVSPMPADEIAPAPSSEG